MFKSLSWYMRAPRRHRPLPRSLASPGDHDLAVVAARATYVGSPEHKDTPFFLGQPRPRADASICDPSLAQQKAELVRWLREAIAAGHVSAHWENGFPRYVWSRQGGDVYEARLVNRETGQYKGYPLNREEWPDGL
jgi:hypothetical protein